MLGSIAAGSATVLANPAKATGAPMVPMIQREQLKAPVGFARVDIHSVSPEDFATFAQRNRHAIADAVSSALAEGHGTLPNEVRFAARDYLA